MMLRSLVLLLLSPLAHHTASALIDLNLNTTTNPPNRIIPQCFTPETGHAMTETNLADCRSALLILARAPDFTTPMRYSKNPRRGLPVPKGWTSGDCLIMVSCENDRDAYTFRLADVLVVARKVVDACVGTVVSPKWGLLRWGGVDEIGGSETFYVAVFKPERPGIRIASEVLGGLGNGTVLDSAIDDA